MWLVARALGVLCHPLPLGASRRIPHSHAVFSLLSAYMMLQALGILWVFGVSLLAVLGTRLLSAVVDSSEEQHTTPFLKRASSTIALVFVYYSVVRMLFVFSQSLWVITWELYDDFPTMRQMLLGRGTAKVQCQPTPATKGNSESTVPQASSSPTLQRQTSPTSSSSSATSRRKIVLGSPLAVLLCLNICLLVGQLACDESSRTTCKESLILEPSARSNRTLRFVLLMSILQWAQVWMGFFPSWHSALSFASGKRARACILLLVILLPTSLARLSMWIWRPAGSGVVHRLPFGLKHHLFDSLLVVAWNMWLILAKMSMLKLRALRNSGFSMDIMRNDESWTDLCFAFKHTGAVWFLIYLLRGCGKWGFAETQTDLILVTLFYPFVLCLIWTVTFVFVVTLRWELPFSKLLIMAAIIGLVTGGAAWLICSMAHRGHSSILVCFVWLQLCRYAFHLARALFRVQTSVLKVQQEQCLQAQLFRRSHSVDFSLDPKLHGELTKTYDSERKIARVMMSALLLICVAFSIVVAICAVLGSAQTRMGLFVSDLVHWRPIANGVQIVNSGASKLTLTRHGHDTAPVRAAMSIADADAVPDYAVCGHTYHSFSLVDYSLLALLAYMNTNQESELPALLATLMPNRTIGIRVERSKNRKWLELEVPTCASNDDSSHDHLLGVQSCRNVTIFSISGTNPTRIADYTENIRMWTEPVALQILSTVFPTVRIWPRHTTSYVISGIHNILNRLGVDDDQWHYKEILERVNELPDDREVVLTGHSLGGGMALIVGALSRRLAVAFQPPGIYHSLAKHQTQHRGETEGTALHRRSVSLIFEGDWIQHFDSHGGLVQTMECDRSDQNVVLACHMLEGAVCHLLRHCGDRRHRFSSCDHDYAPQSTALSVLRSATSSAFAKVNGVIGKSSNASAEHVRPSSEL